ncbi:MAG TPA: hypothetical protein VJ935_09870 [Acidimicrobiia bacterium]|nr:hypothetical protein [Acidimicrobiia bacterium]
MSVVHEFLASSVGLVRGTRRISRTLVWELGLRETSIRHLRAAFVQRGQMRIRKLVITALVGALTVIACGQGTPDEDGDTVTTPTVEIGTTTTSDLGTTTTN